MTFPEKKKNISLLPLAGYQVLPGDAPTKATATVLPPLVESRHTDEIFNDEIFSPGAQSTASNWADLPWGDGFLRNFSPKVVDGEPLKIGTDIVEGSEIR